MERRRNVHFMFNRVTGEKLVIDDRMYNTLMVQLLICDPGDPRFAPYFRLIFDNVFCRVYEVCHFTTEKPSPIRGRLFCHQPKYGLWVQ